jgi:hypothetical protein
MNFNPKQPHGIITGHPWARYEQGGHLFDAAGNSPYDDELVDEGEDEKEAVVDPIPINNVQKNFSLDNAKAFLKNILAEGPLTRSVIFRECSANNQDWESVKSAFAEIGEKFTRRNVIHWKLKAE